MCLFKIWIQADEYNMAGGSTCALVANSLMKHVPGFKLVLIARMSDYCTLKMINHMIGGRVPCCFIKKALLDLSLL